MLIGNAYYNCSCVRYVTSQLTVALSIGFGLLAVIIIIIIIIIVVIACRRRRNKAPEERDAGNNTTGLELTELEEDEDTNYCAIPAAEAENNANEYSIAGPPLPPERKNEYSVLGPPPEPTTGTNNSPYYLSLKNDYTC